MIAAKSGSVIVYTPCTYGPAKGDELTNILGAANGGLRTISDMWWGKSTLYTYKSMIHL